MSYQHDVFISYRRQELWTPWARDHFKKLLEAYLQPELGVEPNIFVDERIHVGADWVDALGEHLATSKVLVAIFSGDYFGSDWCLHELDLMLARSTAASKGKKHVHLIIPVIVHDGELIPPEAKRIQSTDMAKFRNPYINKETQDYQDFADAMGKLAPQVAEVIRSAPAFENKWIKQHRKRFNEVYKASILHKNLEPKQFIANRPAPPTAPPKLI